MRQAPKRCAKLNQCHMRARGEFWPRLRAAFCRRRCRLPGAIALSHQHWSRRGGCSGGRGIAHPARHAYRGDDVEFTVLLSALGQGQRTGIMRSAGEGQIRIRARNESEVIRLRCMDRFFLGVIFASVLLLIVAFALGTPSFKQAGSTDTVVPRTTRGLGFR